MNMNRRGFIARLGICGIAAAPIGLALGNDAGREVNLYAGIGGGRPSELMGVIKFPRSMSYKSFCEFAEPRLESLALDLRAKGNPYCHFRLEEKS